MRCDIVLDLYNILSEGDHYPHETHVLLRDVLRQSSDHDGVVRSIVLPVIFTGRGLCSVSLSPGTAVPLPPSPLTPVLSLSAPAPPPLTPGPGPGA